MSELQFKTGIIGAGPAGLSAAYALNSYGVKTVIIEKYLWGGTCPNYGCDPKKILLTAVQEVAQQRQLKKYGIDGELQINWENLQTRKQTYVDAVEPRKLYGLDQAGIEHIHGTAEFIDEHTIKIQETGDTISAQNWIIAVGQQPKELSFEGSDFLKDSEQFLNEKELSDDVTFVGSGYVGMEFATITSLAGSKTRIVSRSNRPLAEFDEQQVQELVSQMQDNGVEFIFNNEVKFIKKIKNNLFEVELTDGQIFQTNQVYNAAGRVGNFDQLNLKNANVSVSDGGIDVDGELKTSNSSIFAIGDVANAGVAKLVPVGSYQGRFVAQKIAGKNQDSIFYPVISSVAFTSPKLAFTGVPVALAKDRGYFVNDINMSKVITYYRSNDIGHIKSVVNSKGIMVGASVLSNDAEEVINYFVSAINAKQKLDDAKNIIYSYPSYGSDIPDFY